MSHKVQPGPVRIIVIEIAAPAAADPAVVADEVSALLSEHGVEAPDSAIADWRYVHPDWEEWVEAPADVAEGEVFYLPRTRMAVTP